MGVGVSDWCDYGDDYPDVYREENRRARKSYTCSECGGAISPGEPYRSHHSLYKCYGGWQVSRTCSACLIGPAAFVERNCGSWLLEGLFEGLSASYSDGAISDEFTRARVEVWLDQARARRREAAA